MTSLDLPPVLPPLFTSDNEPGLEQSLSSLRPATPPPDLPAAQPAADTDDTPSPSSHFLLPTPNTDPLRTTNSFSFSEPVNVESLAPEILSADISIAPDGSFVETSSGPAARELRRIYDSHLGVSKSVRSPYAITAFVNQHGRQMYRVGHRELSAPAASGADPEDVQQSVRVPSHENPRTKRRSRISVHAFLPPSIFRNSQVTSGESSARNMQQSLDNNQASSSSSGPRKLRKTRSISDMLGAPVAPEAIVGRGHSQSVTAADLPKAYPYGAQPSQPSAESSVRKRDYFGDVMQWSQGNVNGTNTSLSMSTHSVGGSSNSVSRSSSRYDLTSGQNNNASSVNVNSRPIISHPFGHGVSFDSPFRKPALSVTPSAVDEIVELSHHLPPPRFLREMQSFESGLTARQFDPKTDTETDAVEEVVKSIHGHVLNRTVSAVRLRSPLTSTSDVAANVQTEIEEEPVEPRIRRPVNVVKNILPLPETSLHSRYSPAVFDVLQTYRGLPVLDRLPADDETYFFAEPTIKMSLSTDETAAPRNDPRFVIWGDLSTRDDDSDNESLVSSASRQRKKSTTRKQMADQRRRSEAVVSTLPQDTDSRRNRSGSIPQNNSSNMVLVAATIERWIAQLTSEINYDELLNFFLTYRTYVSAVDLCHLLICRFHWALGIVIDAEENEQFKFVRDGGAASSEMVKRVVRLRTFVAIRYWLLTFFSVDFVPNRELRLLVAGWLNTLVKDPILKQHPDGVSIVRKLIKVVKDCKATHTKTSPTPKRQTIVAPSTNSSKLLGEKFAEATRKTFPEEEDSDVDLDFFPDEEALRDIPTGFQVDSVNAHLNVGYVRSGLSPAGTGPASIPLSSLSILQHTGGISGSTDPDLSFVDTSATLPIHHNALSRALVNTIGRLGRWKRVLNSRSSAPRAPIGACADVSAFDLELNVARDLLTVNGGVEQYLRMIEPRADPIQSRSLQPASSVLSTDSPTATEPNYFPNIANPAPLLSSLPTTPAPKMTTSPSSSSAPAPTTTESTSVESSVVSAVLPGPNSERPVSTITVESERPISTVSVSTIATADLPNPPGLSNARSISLRSSSTDSLGEPMSRNSALAPPSHWQFDVVSIDELDLSDTSSDDEAAPAAPPGLRKVPRRLPLRRDFEFVPRPESVSSMGIHSVISSAVSSISVGGPLAGGIQQWQMNALLDSLSNDDQESGDVEAALRRLEGEINPERQIEKASKVEGWVKNIRDRMQAGDYTDNEPRNYSDDEESDSNEQSEDEDDGREEYNSSSRTSNDELQLDHSNTPLASTYPDSISASPASPARSDKPALEDAVPLEILQSRVDHNHAQNVAPRPSISSKFGIEQDIPRVHRSFVLGFRAETLVEHFSMIDRELFMGIKFEELVLDDWMACEEVNVLDWAQFLKDRARWKAESRFPDKTSALAAVRARFNLIANFTLSEVVLTQPNERPLVVGKFIRIAWKAYSLHSFNTLVAIITGLKSDWVTRAMRSSWHKVTVWEKRMFKDLKQYVSRLDDFRHIRQAVEKIADFKALDISQHAASVISGGTEAAKLNSDAKVAALPPASACIPFIGIYMSQLYRHNRLPDLIDPTAPKEAVSVDPITANFDAPAHPEVFSALTPLPPSMQLEPLINVHKQRMIAGVIKSLVAGQHLASRVQFPVDKKLFQRCLKLRGLDAETLKKVVDMYE